MKKILIFGCGAMGGAILSGCLAKGLWSKDEIYVKEHSEETSGKRLPAMASILPWTAVKRRKRTW